MLHFLFSCMICTYISLSIITYKIQCSQCDVVFDSIVMNFFHKLSLILSHLKPKFVKIEYDLHYLHG